MLLDEPRLDLHGYLRKLEEVIIRYLADLGITGSRKEGFTGVFAGEEKIAAIGVKFNKRRKGRGFVTSHGFALNIKSGIQHEGFTGIIPCGIEQYGVTSLEDVTGRSYEMQQVVEAMLPYFLDVFRLPSFSVVPWVEDL